jgi:pimeloyl-ACP methyl ester carboxylesterase
MTALEAAAPPALRGPLSGMPGQGGRWLWRTMSSLAQPVVQEAATLLRAASIRQTSAWADPPLDAGGLPVLLVGGLASTPQSLATLHDWLERLNFSPAISPINFGIDCGERSAGRVSDALADLVDASGRRAALVAHSRGGHFARAVAVRHPDLVDCLVTLGSPVNRMLGVHPMLLAEIGMIGLMGSLGLPGLMRPSCLFGRCCRTLRDDLFAPFPKQVPYLSIFSREDRLVDWRSCVDPGARHREVRSTHAGMVCSPVALMAVAEELHALGSRADRDAVAPVVGQDLEERSVARPQHLTRARDLVGHRDLA